MTSSTSALSDPLDLDGRSRELLAAASSAGSGRAADNLLAGTGGGLTQTLLALVAGTTLADHTAPGPATLLVLDGEATLTTGDDRRRVSSGQWVQVPTASHGLHAETDAVCLLTVAPATQESDRDAAT